MKTIQPTTQPMTLDLPRFARLSIGQWKLATSASLIALSRSLPLVMIGFSLFQSTSSFVYSLALLGLTLLIGFNGQFSLGHSAFLALGDTPRR